MENEYDDSLNLTIFSLFNDVICNPLLFCNIIKFLNYNDYHNLKCCKALKIITDDNTTEVYTKKTQRDIWDELINTNCSYIMKFIGECPYKQKKYGRLAKRVQQNNSIDFLLMAYKMDLLDDRFFKKKSVCNELFQNISFVRKLVANNIEIKSTYFIEGVNREDCGFYISNLINVMLEYGKTEAHIAKCILHKHMSKSLWVIDLAIEKGITLQSLFNRATYIIDDHIILTLYQYVSYDENDKLRFVNFNECIEIINEHILHTSNKEEFIEDIEDRDDLDNDYVCYARILGLLLRLRKSHI